MNAIHALSTLACIASICWAQSSKLELAAKRYVDPKGYFTVVPPAGWKIQEYPGDIRGKVAFLDQSGNVDLRVLVNAVNFSTTDKLIEFCRDAEKRLGVRMKIEKFDFYGREAVRRSFEFRGQRFLYVDFLIGKADHNLAYSAPPQKYDMYLPVILKSMETYEPNIRAVGDKERVDHLVAKKLRLGRLMLEAGRADLALEYVREGMAIAPNNQELLKLKREVDLRFKKPDEQDSVAGGKRFESKKFGFTFNVPENVTVYTADSPGPMTSRINSETPLWLVNSSLASERINLKVSQYQDATESELEQGKRELEKGTPFRSMSQYRKISVGFIRIGKDNDKRAVEHVHTLEQRVPKKLRQIMFIHRGRLFSFTCATSPERYDNADQQFFDVIFKTMEFK